MTPEGVDHRMVEMLDSKQRLSVRTSDIADASPEALDISEATLAKTLLRVQTALTRPASPQLDETVRGLALNLPAPNPVVLPDGLEAHASSIT